MNKKEAIELLKNSWFVSLDGKSTQVGVAQAIGLAEKALEEAKPYKAKAKALRAENKALETENKALREELVKLLSALKTLLGNVTFVDWVQPEFVTLMIKAPREEYLKNVDPLEARLNPAEEKNDAENQG